MTESDFFKKKWNKLASLKAPLVQNYDPLTNQSTDRPTHPPNNPPSGGAGSPCVFQKCTTTKKLASLEATIDRISDRD